MSSEPGRLFWYYLLRVGGLLCGLVVAGAWLTGGFGDAMSAVAGASLGAASVALISFSVSVLAKAAAGGLSGGAGAKGLRLLMLVARYGLLAAAVAAALIWFRMSPGWLLAGLVAVHAGVLVAGAVAASR